MNQDDVSASDIQDALADAARVASQREQAAARPSEAPAARARWRAAAIVALVLVIAWDAYVLTRPPRGLPTPELEADLRLLVATTVEEIEDFRAAEGRLPRPDEVSDLLLDDAMSYVPSGAGYVLTAEDGGVQLRYDSGAALDAFIDPAAGGASGGRGPS